MISHIYFACKVDQALAAAICYFSPNPRPNPKANAMTIITKQIHIQAQQQAPSPLGHTSLLSLNCKEIKTCHN